MSTVPIDFDTCMYVLWSRVYGFILNPLPSPKSVFTVRRTICLSSRFTTWRLVGIALFGSCCLDILSQSVSTARVLSSIHDEHSAKA